MPEPEPRDVVDRLEDAGLTHDEALDEARRMHDSQLARNGWVAHLVPDDPGSPTGYNACTYGVLESFGHPDFQLVLPLPPGTAGGILSGLVDEVKAGRRFEAGCTARVIVSDFTVGFAAATEGGREVLRVILPDRRGRVALGEIEARFARQYEGTR